MVGSASKTSAFGSSALLHESFNPAEARKTLGQRWIETLVNYSTLHGVGWYSYVQSPFWRTGIVLGTLIIMVLLPIHIVSESIAFFRNQKVENSVTWLRVDEMDFPNITLCHPRFFNSKRLREFGISNELAGFLTFALDPNIVDYYNSFEDEFDESNLRVHQVLRGHGANISQILRDNQITIKELFLKVAVRCEEFIMYCEVNRKSYSNRLTIREGSNATSCCEAMFHQEPLFVFSGTCFTTKTTVAERFPSIFNSLKIWTYLHRKNAPTFDIAWKGSDAAERTGIAWTLSKKTNPALLLNIQPNRIPTGSHASVALTRTETDKTQLSNGCLDQNDTFTRITGLPYTKSNCQGFANHYMFGNCSLAVYYGYKTWNDIPPCRPEDILNRQGWSTQNLSSPTPACPEDCQSLDFETTTSVTDIDEEVIEVFARSAMMLDAEGQVIYDSPKDVNCLQLYFQSFDYAKTNLFMETYFEFFGKIGGTMSLIIGASIISLIEVVYFLVYLVGVIFIDFRSIRLFFEGFCGKREVHPHSTSHTQIAH